MPKYINEYLCSSPISAVDTVKSTMDEFSLRNSAISASMSIMDEFSSRDLASSSSMMKEALQLDPIRELNESMKTSALELQLPNQYAKLDIPINSTMDEFSDLAINAGNSSMMKEALQLDPIRELNESMKTSALELQLPDQYAKLNIHTFPSIGESISERAFDALHNMESFNLISRLNLPLSELTAIGIDLYDYSYEDYEDDEIEDTAVISRPNEDDEIEDTAVISRPNKELIILDTKLILDTKFIHKIQKNPSIIYEISPREFEEMMATIFEQQGYEVKLTKKTRDGGKDIHLIDNRPIGRFIYLVECKRHNVNNKVGVGIVRQLYGVVQKTRANAGILVTTSSFTKPAKEFQQDVVTQISLKDYLDIQKWINQYH